MTKSKRTQFELFVKSSHFFRGVIITFSLIIPLLAFNALGYMSLAPSFVFGAFLNSPSDVPGSLRRKVNGTLVSIVLTVLITVLFLFVDHNFLLTLFLIAIVTFIISLFSAYGFRASLAGFSGILAMVLALVVEKNTAFEIWTHGFYIFLGGLWYLFASVTFHKLSPKKDDDQLLSETLKLTGNYLKIRAKLLTSDSERETLVKQTYALQAQINEKHETLRELLLTNRKRSGRSHFDEKRLLIFISLVDIYELVIANSWDYEKFDNLFSDDKKHIEKFSQLNLSLSQQLIHLSQIMITKDDIPDNKKIDQCLQEANNTIADYISIHKLPQAREGALMMRNLYDFQKKILQEVEAIRYALANINERSKVTTKRSETSQFLTLQEYKPRILLQHFTTDSVILRHGLRLTIAMAFAYIIGSIFEIQNAYWIMLTVLVILRPNYGLTKERAKDRIIGTVIGGAIAFGIVILTQNEIVYGVLAVISLILAFALMQQNYRWAAALITLNVVFIYSFITPNAFSVIQYRIIDTIIGGVISFLAIYTLFPSWEALNLKNVLLKAVNKNNSYLKATQELYIDKAINQLSYKLARKEAFLALSELSAALQRITQDPKSKQIEFRLIYNIVTLNQTILSGIASLGGFIQSHKTTPISEETNALFAKITNTLSRTAILLDEEHEFKVQPHGNIREAKEKLLESYQVLSEERDADIKEGNLEIKKADLHELQEAHLVSNQLIWLVSLSSNLRKSITKYEDHFGQTKE
ncbi:FUSC family protein [Brumimicrobium mesophilum]|uniref:FUSC family protein n=1 Tax=Brumimicrobium mesophilum TaxID=392717 RepID=UPI000D144770|nr:FUSC family membrane protein [Brumimicrobium mesophilum]